MMTALSLNGVKVLSCMGLVLSLSLFTTQVYADEYAYKPSGKYLLQPLKHGEKWQTDEVLRTGMDSIRETITVRQDDVLKERLVASEYLRLANEIDKNIAYIIKNFKLTADADRAFRNVVLVDLSEGTGLMRSSKDIQVQRLGALGVLQTLRNYGKYFQHSGWHYA